MTSDIFYKLYRVEKNKEIVVETKKGEMIWGHFLELDYDIDTKAYILITHSLFFSRRIYLSEIKDLAS